jgi:aerobic-type carbon monoxide dehydrogenase small subunit (CoxS/CutS family)
MHLSLNVNHRIYDVDVPQGTTVLGALRDDLGLTGTRFGCGQGVCGACMVLVDAVPIPSCTLGAHEVVGKQIVTIEGLAHQGTLHPVQRAFLDEDAMQCGYCTSGMVLSAAALLARTPHPTDVQIRDALAPHLCRCGVYGRVIRAVRKAAR